MKSTKGKTNKEEISLDVLFELSEFFKFFSDTTRIRIIEILLHGEMSVNDIADKLKIGQSAVSHQLRLLRTSHLVRPRRDGRTVFYALDDEHIGLIFQTGLNHILHKKGVSANYIQNYVEGISPSEYAEIYTRISISPKISTYTFPKNLTAQSENQADI